MIMINICIAGTFMKFECAGGSDGTKTLGKLQSKLDAMLEYDLTKIEIFRDTKEFETSIRTHFPKDAKIAIFVEAPTSSMKVIMDCASAA